MNQLFSWAQVAATPDRPYLDSKYPHLIRCPCPDNQQFTTSDRVWRMVGSAIFSQGVSYESKTKEFILNSSHLNEGELKDRVQLVIARGKELSYLDYKISFLHPASDPELALVESLKRDVSLFKKKLQTSTTEQVKSALEEAHRTQLAEYKTIYDTMVLTTKHREQSMLSTNPTANFSKMYSMAHSALSPRDYTFTILLSNSVQEPDSIENESLSVHGCVIEVNGGLMKTAFTSGMLEESRKQMVITVSHQDILKKLVQYLYGMPIVLATDQEATELYHLADQWELEPLKKICQPRAMLQHIRQADPSKLPSLEEAGFGGSVEEMVQAAEKAKKSIQRTYETYLEPHILRLTRVER